MVDTDYNVAVGVFFVPYVLCEVPSNLLLAKFKKASWYMGFLVVCWGIVSGVSLNVCPAWHLTVSRS